MKEKKYKLFISHASKDQVFVEALIKLFEFMGIGQNTERIICTSVEGYGIPLDANIFDFLKEQFLDYHLYVIFLLSSNYYASPVCLNEMGAAWVLQTRYTSILVPGFRFDMIRGAIDPAKKAIQMDARDIQIKDGLNNLKDNLLSVFGLGDLAQTRWERYRDQFIEEVKAVGCLSSPDIEEVSAAECLKSIVKQEEHKERNIKSSFIAAVLLAYAGDDPTGIICYKRDDFKESLTIGNQQVSIEKIFATERNKWKRSLDELEDFHIIKSLGSERCLYQLTEKGIEWAKWAAKIIDTKKKMQEYLFL